MIGPRFWWRVRPKKFPLKLGGGRRSTANGSRRNLEGNLHLIAYLVWIRRRLRRDPFAVERRPPPNFRGNFSGRPRLRKRGPSAVLESLNVTHTTSERDTHWFEHGARATFPEPRPARKVSSKVGRGSALHGKRISCDLVRIGLVVPGFEPSITRF